MQSDQYSHHFSDESSQYKRYNQVARIERMNTVAHRKSPGRDLNSSSNLFDRRQIPSSQIPNVDQSRNQMNQNSF